MASQLLTAQDIIAFTDDEILAYLEDQRKQTGSRIVQVQDPKNLPKSFILRLRELANRPPPSKPVDLDQVSARLDNLLDPPSVDLNASRVIDYIPPTYEEWRADAIKEETVEYHRLQREGCRPYISLGQFINISKAPEKFRDLLEPFDQDQREDYVHWCDVYSTQRWRWNNFRKRQAEARRETSDNLRQYTVDATQRLATAGVVKPLHFSIDVSRQDQLTTWLEYLDFSIKNADDFAGRRPDLYIYCRKYLPWIISQIPLIEAEMEESSTAGPTAWSGSKRGREQDTSPKAFEAPPSAKRQKLGRAGAATPIDRPTTRGMKAITTNPGNVLAGSTYKPPSADANPQPPLRRSQRVAERLAKAAQQAQQQQAQQQPQGRTLKAVPRRRR